MSLSLIIVLVWLCVAVLVIAAGMILTWNREPPHYLTLTVIAEEPSAENVNEAEREAA